LTTKFFIPIRFQVR